MSGNFFQPSYSKFCIIRPLKIELQIGRKWQVAAQEMYNKHVV